MSVASLEQQFLPDFILRRGRDAERILFRNKELTTKIFERVLVLLWEMFYNYVIRKGLSNYAAVYRGQICVRNYLPLRGSIPQYSSKMYIVEEWQGRTTHSMASLHHCKEKYFSFSFCFILI